MKKPTKPTEPKIPKRFKELIWLHEIEAESTVQLFNFDWVEEILRQEFHLNRNLAAIVSYARSRASDFELNLYYDYSPELIFTFPAEAALFENPRYEFDLAKFEKAVEEFPAKLALYEEQFEEWKIANADELAALRQKKIDMAHKLLKEAEELK